MKNKKLLYAKAVFGKEERRAVAETLKNNWLSAGKKSEEFEQKIAELFGKKYGVFVNSGSSANLLALKVLNLPVGSEVITPVLTFATTLAPIIQLGLKPVFVDCEIGTYLPSLSEIRKKITLQTKALMIPHLIGNLMNGEDIRNLAKEHNLIYIEDSCDTLGGSINNFRTGYYSYLTTTSFYASHIITAMGGGGMVMTSDENIAKRLKALRDWGRGIDDNEDIEKRFSYALDGIYYDAKFIFIEMGYNFKPIDAMAAFGLEQLKKLGKFTAIRQRNFEALYNFFGQYSQWFHLPKQLSRAKVNWLAFPLTIKEDAPFTRLELVKHFESRGVQTRPIFSGNILRQPAFQLVANGAEKFTNADSVMRNGFLLGIHQGLTLKDINYVKKIFKGMSLPFSE